MNYLEHCIEYIDLGCEVSLITIFGKDAIQMVKTYSHPAKRKLLCQQMWSHNRLTNEGQLFNILKFLYDDIQKQEETGEYREEIR